jgi:hypothetical protein
MLAMRARYSEWTRYGAYRIARGVFALAVRRGLITRSPVDGLSGAEIPSQRNAKQAAVLSADQLDLLVDKAGTPRWKALLGAAA